MRVSRELEASLTLAVSETRRRRHEFITIEVLLYALLHDDGVAEIVRQCGGDATRMIRSLEHYFAEQIEALPADRDAQPQHTIGFQRVIQRAAAHVQSAGKQEILTRDVLVAILREPESFAAMLIDEQGISRLDVLNYISHGISKIGEEPEPAAGAEADGDEGGEAAPKADPLALYATDLIAKAAAGKIDPLVGREAELARVARVLCRRRKNNPVLVGEPGVGKTALAEGLARQIQMGSVPGALRGARVFALDMGALLAGTRFRGDFEQRLKSVLAALRKHPGAILFIDEVHTVVGAGAASGGTLDASNILKPALASGELRCLGATTYHDFKNYFERDRALARRFQKIEVAEPTVEQAHEILRGLKRPYEEHHGVVYTRGALRAAVELSARYINDRHLPDKAFDVIDEAGATLQMNAAASGEPAEKTVRVEHVEQIVAAMAKIPPRSVSVSDRERLRSLDRDLKLTVFGQDEAITSLVSAIKLSRAGLASPERPVGCFLFAGPTGVGKTEVAKQLASALGVEFLRYDMSEYMEAHTVSRLIGAPPGYVGFDQGGLLTDAIRKTPHAVLLLDEIEKAHPNLFNILLQVMDHATLTDNNGRKADFRNVVLIMTTNAGAQEMAAAAIGFGGRSNAHQGVRAIERLFAPEFRNRLDATIAFAALSPAVIERVVDKFILELDAQLNEKRVFIQITPAARAYLAGKGYDATFGARPMARLIQTEIKRVLADEILFGRLTRGGRVEIDAGADALAFAYRPNEETESRSEPAELDDEVIDD